MPISLPPLSRRRFLASTLAAGASLLASRWLGAADKPRNPHRIALLSDTHVYADKAAIAKNKAGETNPWDHLQRVTREILELKEDPSMLLISGDCAAKDGVPGDYTTLIEGLAPIRKAGTPIHMVLGNHDHRENFLKALPADDVRQNDAAVADRVVCLISTERANFFMLDSLDKTNVTPGILGEKQLEWLARSLDARPDKPAIVIVHHDPDLVRKKFGITDTEEFLKILKPRKQVKAYVYGHTHTWEHQEIEGIHLVNLPPTAWVFNAKFPQGWVDLNLRPEGATFELRALKPDHPQHGQKLELKWRT